MDTRETITLDARAQHRLYVLEHVRDGSLGVAEAARVLQLSLRQVRRLLAAHRADGAAALVHGNRGRSPRHRTPLELRERLVELATTSYAGVNHAHLAELLAEREGVTVAERTLRRILAEAGVRPVRRRRPPRHRSRRDRMPRAGLLLQVDGSRHDWLGDRGPHLTLVGGIDDATGTVTGATFRPQEDAAGYFAMLTQTVRAFGLPLAVYSDRHGIFQRQPNRPPTLTEQLTGSRSLTQVGRALDALEIRWLGARSAQAKGRVERLWGTLQDRLVAELRLAGAATIEEANSLLALYLPRHNARFAVPPAEPEPAWRSLPLGHLPEAVLCFHYARRVANDATISWAGEALALPRRPDGRSWAGRSVVVQERLDASLWVSHGQLCLPLVAAPPGPIQLRARHIARAAEGRPDQAPATVSSTARRTPASARVPWKPAPDHPWRRSHSPSGR